MQNRKRLYLLSSLMLISLLILGSGCDLTLGPKTKTVYTLIHPGRPVQVVEKTIVTGRVLDGTGDALRQDIGGWIVMPKDHFDAMQKAIEVKAK